MEFNSIDCVGLSLFSFLFCFQSKLKDSQFQLAPWPPVEATPSHFAIQSPGHLVGGAAMVTSICTIIYSY